ncbi:unnamed protein product [Symbiodinium microadriaticum]|nr:unnamed protein product [Symbiodinium microadriaticum]
MCAAAVVSIYMDLCITGFALPPPLDKMFDDLKDLIKEALEDTFSQTSKADNDKIAKCFPGGATKYVKDTAATVAATLIIQACGLPLQLQLVELLSSDKLFCIEAWKTEGFDESPCAENLGCSGSGIDSLPEPGVVKQPASPTFKVDSGKPASTEEQCNTHPTHLAFGDFFLEIGDFRIAEHDWGEWSHKDNAKAIVLFKKDWGAANQDSSRLSDPKWRNEAWARPGAVECSIKMGFQFIQIGSFRLGADDFALMVSQPYLQIGQFRLGYTGTSVVILNAKGGTTNNRLIEQWHSNGNLDANRVKALDNQDLRNSFVSRPAHKLPCPQIGDIAFGRCDPSFGAWGDRFVQLGEFRLAAIDGNHFSVSHSRRVTAMIFRGDGELFPGPTAAYHAWDRLIGFPHGVTFGRNFVQIGNFRLADIDGNHLTVSHISGGTAVIFRGDGHIFNGPWPTADYNAWSKDCVGVAWSSKIFGQVVSEGGQKLAAGVRFGKHFLEIGNFRLGDTDGKHLVVSKGHQTIRIYRDDGLRFGDVPGYGKTLAEKPLQSHCGLIQSITGTCPGITAGDGFLQFGDWRLAVHSDHVHFSAYHHSTGSPIYSAPKDLSPTRPNCPRTDWGGWDSHFGATGVGFGDHFIHMHNWRIGSVRHGNENYLTISNVHFDGGKGSILGFSRTGAQARLNFGGLFAGPHKRDFGAPKGSTFGDRFVQIGKFRIGDVDGEHFSVAHVGEDESDENGKYHLKKDDDKTIVVYKSDGTHITNPAKVDDKAVDTTVGRPFAPCRATEMH